MKVKVDSLARRALTWAAVQAQGFQPVLGMGAKVVAYRTDHGSWDYPRINEQEAGEIIKRHWIGLERPSSGQTPPQWRALADFKGKQPSLKSNLAVVSAWSTDMATAVFRCLVKSRFGEVIDIPDELVADCSDPAIAASVLEQQGVN